MTRRWWRKRALRIYHPNATAEEMVQIDVAAFVADCVRTNAEAVVISAAGVYAFYPSLVPWHHVPQSLGERDLVGEIITQARSQGLRVIARVDFSKARPEVLNAQPDWFARDAEGQPVASGDYWATCPLGDYQGQSFAQPVLQELLTRYALDGIHVNAGGFANDCYCAACQAAVQAALGQAVPRWEQASIDERVAWLQWRQQAVAERLRGLYNVAQALQPDLLFIAELAGPEEPAWARKAGHAVPALSRTFSQMLFTAGGLASARSSRYWAGLAADQALGVRRKRRPLINIKMQMRDLGRPHAMLPSAEIERLAYQAVAHGAGLKLPTFGLPGNQTDPRVLSVVSEVLGFVRKQSHVLDGFRPISDAALIWPHAALTRASALDDPAPGEALRQEALGLYEALKARHVLVALLGDDALTAKNLARHDAVVLPCLAMLDEPAREELFAYVEQGGRLLVGECLPYSQACETEATGMQALAAFLGCQIGPIGACAPYGTLEYTEYTVNPHQQGPLPLWGDRRLVADPGDALVWLRAADATVAGVPEDLRAPTTGHDALLLSQVLGEGVLSYCAMGLGQLYRQYGLGDHATLVAKVVHYGASLRRLLEVDAPSTVEVTMAHWQDGVVIHLVNHAGSVPADGATTVGPVTLNLAWDGPANVVLATPGQPDQALPSHEQWNRVQITVPCVRSYAQVIVRTG